MTQTLFIVDLNRVVLKSSSLKDASVVCLSSPKIEVEGDEKGDRICFKARLSDNILNHVLVLAGISYTYGFPLEFAKGVSFDKLAKLNASGLKHFPWFLVNLVLDSEIEGLEGLLDALSEIEEFIHEGSEPSKIRLALVEMKKQNEKVWEAYPKIGSWEAFLDELKSKLDRNAFRLLRDSIRECYDTFYANYWEKQEKRLSNLSRRLKKTTDILQPLKKLEDITNAKFPYSILEVFLIDIFRRGGGIYVGSTNRITSTSGECVPLYIHTDIGHEVGHMLMRGWDTDLIEEIEELATKLKTENRFILARLIEEHIAALIQLKLDRYYYGDRRITHSYMENEIFRMAEEIWDKSKQELGSSWSLTNFMRELLDELKESEKAIKELTGLMNEWCGLKNNQAYYIIGANCFTRIV